MTDPRKSLLNTCTPLGGAPFRVLHLIDVAGSGGAETVFVPSLVISAVEIRMLLW